MNFFKKLFSKGDKKENTAESDKDKVEVFTQEYFDNRYTKEDIRSYNKVLDGSLKLIESFFLDFKLNRVIESPVNHPLNMDQTFDQLINFKMYCNGFKLDNDSVTMALSIAFSDFLIQKYGFELYKDKTPESPMRALTLKYDKDNIVLSIYPYEYSAKVMALQATYEDLENKIKDKLEILPQYSEKVNEILGKED